MKNFDKLNNPTQEELFDLWAAELIQLGYILDVIKNESIPPFVTSRPVTEDKVTYKTVYKGTPREKKKVTTKKITLLRGSTYTPDRVIIWAQKSYGIFYGTELGCDPYFTAQKQMTHPKTGEKAYFSYVDVKAPPGYGGRNCSDVSFSLNQKWVFAKFGVYVNKCYNSPNKKVKVTKPYLWLETFTPQRYLWTDKLTKMRAIPNWKPRTAKEFLKL